MKKGAAKGQTRQAARPEIVGATGTIGDDGRFIPHPPGASIFSPSHLTQRSSLIATASPSRAVTHAQRSVKAKPMTKKADKTKKKAPAKTPKRKP